MLAKLSTPLTMHTWLKCQRLQLIEVCTQPWKSRRSEI